jgi:hypothetical protein
MKRVVSVLEQPGRYHWFDTLGPRIATELANGLSCGPAMAEMYANLNHHDSIIRGQVIRIAWLVRSHVQMWLAAERVLFNVGASHGGAEAGLAIPRAASQNDEDFLRCIECESVWPDFARGESYGYGLDSDRPEHRDAVLRRSLDELWSPGSDLLQYVRRPNDLMDFERQVIEALVALTSELATPTDLHTP